jgi:hypothetical protein
MNDKQVDVVADLLNAVIAAKPDDAFCISLLEQYQMRGGLSKKQLEGLLGKATKFTEVSPGKLATLEAIIKKKKLIERSAATIDHKEAPIDDTPLMQMNEILEKNTSHRRILFLKSKWEQAGKLSTEETDDIKRLHKILCS